MKPLGASDPMVIGRYRILAELGRGGMGRVLLGSGPDGRLVAVKLVSSLFVEDEGFRARFSLEVEASRRVSGAYTAAVVEADADAEVPWLASVFVPGPSLYEAVTVAGPLPEESALRLAAGLATALLEIHRVGLVHRDLKPSNVLLTDDGLRVIDFGIAKAVDDFSGQLTRTGSTVGSPGFMSPEQAEAGTLGPASDVFSLGAVLAAACTGRSPFAGSSTLQTLNNVVSVHPDLSAIPSRVRRIVERCLEKDPRRRPSPEEILNLAHPVPPSVRPWLPAVQRMIDDQRAAVAQVLSGEAPEQTVRVTVPPPHSTSVIPARRGRRRTVAAIAGAAVVALSAVAVVIWQNWPTSASGEPAQAPPSPSTKELRLYWNGALQDNATCVTDECLGRYRVGYQPAHPEGRVLVSREDGTVPLKTYRNEARGDIVSCGTDTCVNQNKHDGYVFIRDEGYVYRAQRPGTVPLRLYWHEGRKDNATCVTDKCNEDQKNAGYKYIRDEGFVYPVG
ncbi:hypothetical protein JOF56_008286 [Kibdelosporangium banguiense]|uniref:Protein kinase domain-containing protein n=1 Tax=Kibdelosporangium banguiense TaxID=1365924 RepID=A0ABS4TU06_9PSEU|nr:serine/threonine-protein kinase [Kibdelosporangium banguiense]MBP2327901.1 hypothetical protein [Kibdelosporangium banguiense]